MDDGGPGASIIAFILLILTDMVFYGFGAALHALNTRDVMKAAEDGEGKSIRLKEMIVNPGHFVNTLQLVVTVVNLLMGGFYLRLWYQYIHIFVISVAEHNLKLTYSVEIIKIISMLISGAVLVYLLLTFGVLIPRRLANKYPEKWAYALVWPMHFITKLLMPFTCIVTVTAGFILRLFGIKTSTDVTDVTEEEIISMVNEGHEQGVIQASEAVMITNIFEFGDKEAQDIMTHRTNIVGIDAETSFREAIRFMLSESNSRYPVYEENIDHIIGILHMKDALRIQAANEGLDGPVRDIPGLIREARFIPETRNIDDLFHTMQSINQQMVIVVDEYGQTSGLIAMEDILEEIVGNLMDEYDEDEAYIEEKGNDEYIIEGKMPLEDLEEKFHITFEEEEFETLNGFMISRMDKIPEPDEKFDVDVQGYNFKVLTVDNKRIQSVLVTKLPWAAGDGTDDDRDKQEKNQPGNDKGD